MRAPRILIGTGLVTLMLMTAACGSLGGNRTAREPVQTPSGKEVLDEIQAREGKPKGRGTIWDIFKPREDPGRVGAVNKYIWNAAIDVLYFLPIETIDPFTGVIVTGWGTASGSSRAFRATVKVTDPALDARSLNVALLTRSGPADPATVRAIEDAILTRARQLRAEDAKF